MVVLLFKFYQPAIPPKRHQAAHSKVLREQHGRNLSRNERESMNLYFGPNLPFLKYESGNQHKLGMGVPSTIDDKFGFNLGTAHR